MLVQGHITQENPMQLEHIKLVEASTAVVWLLHRTRKVQCFTIEQYDRNLSIRL